MLQNRYKALTIMKKIMIGEEEGNDSHDTNDDDEKEKIL